jgi:hypothetical protein
LSALGKVQVISRAALRPLRFLNRLHFGSPLRRTGNIGAGAELLKIPVLES